MKKLFTFLPLFVISMCTFAQSNDSINMALNQHEADLSVLKRIKIEAYIQAQYQIAEANGAKSFEGGNFAEGVDKRFMLRRGRFRLTYEHNNFKLFMQPNLSENGIQLMDFWGKIKDNKWNSFGLQMGLMNRPFGYEIGYSSMTRETPERGRMSQSIFPSERDLGAMVMYEPLSASRMHWLKIEAGIYNGTGTANPIDIATKGAGPDFDYKKDFIGHFILKNSYFGERLKISGGASYYNGGIVQANKFVYSMSTNSDGESIFAVDSSTNNKGKIAKKEYMGADFQASYDWKGGLTTIRAEYIQGVQPSSKSDSRTSPVAPSAETVNRNFNGAYFYFVQNIAHSKHNIVVKYDWYDPNTKISGMELTAKDSKGKSTNITATDINYKTLGLGYLYTLNEHVKLMLYFAYVENENTKLAGYTSNLKDNVFTARVQYKF
ncbi:MAG: hypothetical protein RL065_2004 [Bacteroidota bacterium]